MQMMDVDVLVVGGGISGMAVARHLAARRIRCQVLEVGAGPTLDRRFASMADFRLQMQPHLKVDEEMWGYSCHGEPFNWTRVRAIGGRTLLWGGWVVWPDQHSWCDAQSWGRPWPISYKDFQPLLWRAAHSMNSVKLARQPDFDVISHDLGLTVEAKLAAKGPFGERPYHPLDGGTGDYLSIINGTVCTKVQLENGRCTGMEYIDLQRGDVHCKRARAVVLCASPVETARILLSSGLDLHSDVAETVGQGLTEHIVSAYIVITTKKPGTNNYLTTGHNVAFMPRIERQSKSYRGGFTVELHGPDALDLLEDPHLSQIGLTRQEAGEYSGYLIYVIGEVGPSALRYVDLDMRRTDSLGRVMPRFNCQWNEEDRAIARDMDEIGQQIAQSLSHRYEGKFFRLLNTLSLGGSGISHEAGTCAMGADQRRSVVGIDGQVHNVSGLFVGDASIMPTGLDCPPTLALVGLALNTADGIERALSRRDI
ncbi:GMC family oxidoreductase [Pseudomonas citronellolis]|uniref:GMC oxidoreductase n=1 Tax=Pseudomonas citronellolis TaxID=53408 RepID=UPI002648077A|nr:GMC family oxidoreductase [Pseudomonas citronellolis]MDN6875427.1 GMC family oxidoreductase [Pseudomonas citronellolis]